jgi:RHS repeat-associated protein
VTAGGVRTVTRFACDGANAGADLNGSNALVMRRLYLDGTDRLLARIVWGGNAAWYLTDTRGSVRDIANYAGTMVLDHIDYDGYGVVGNETVPGSGDRYKYTGRELDSVTGLQYNRARYYDPKTGRWTSQDPLAFRAGDSNLYRYVRNMPTGATDPGGVDLAGVVPFPGIDYPIPNPFAIWPGWGPVFIGGPQPPATPGPEHIGLPLPEQGCSGYCMDIKDSHVVSMTINRFHFEPGHGRQCPAWAAVLELSGATGVIEGQIRRMLAQPGGWSINNCCEGCSCQDRKRYDGKRVEVQFNGESLELDPANFDPPLNTSFNRGDCYIQLWGTVVIQVGTGSVGVCKPNAAPPQPVPHEGVLPPGVVPPFRPGQPVPRGI